MMALTFAPQGELVETRHVRRARFEERSMLAVSAAVLVANAARESLGALYGAPLHVRLFEPTIPAPQAWNAIGSGALVYRMRGARGDAAIVIRGADAVALATHAFGESDASDRPLSPMERTVLERAVNAVADGCSVVCGPLDGPARLAPELGANGFVTYFELQIERPIRARIGVALAQDPSPETRSEVRLEDLHDVRVEVAVRTEEAFVAAGDLATLEVGAIVPITRERAFRGSLFLAGRPLCGGECGVRDGRYALAIGSYQNDEGSFEQAL